MRIALFIILLVSSPLASFAGVVLDLGSNTVATVISGQENTELLIQYPDKTVKKVAVGSVIPEVTQCSSDVCPGYRVKTDKTGDQVLLVSHLFSNGIYAVAPEWTAYTFDAEKTEQAEHLVSRASITAFSIPGQCYHQACRGDYFTGKFKKGLPMFSHEYAAVRLPNSEKKGTIRILDLLSDGTVYTAPYVVAVHPSLFSWRTIRTIDDVVIVQP